MGVVMCVCTGNVCRSPMAEGLLRQRLAEAGHGARIEVGSTGTWALDGHPASPHAVTVMAERGIDISDHIAHTISSADAAEADLILAMSREHVQLIEVTWPQYAWKTHLLSSLVGKRADIRDPYAGPIEEYRDCADDIAAYIEAGLNRILELA